MQTIRVLPRTLLILALVLAMLLPAALPVRAQATATLHYHRPAGDYDGWGLHVWGDAAQETTWADPLTPAGSDDFGVFWEVSLRADAKELAFIIHNGEEKDPGPNQALDLTQGAAAWVVSGSPEVYLLAVDPAEVATDLPVTTEPQPAEPVAALGDGQFVRSAILHDSRADLYRTPFGAQPFSTTVTLRLRTAADDVEEAALLIGGVSSGAARRVPMTKVASDGPFDWWETAIETGSQPDVLAYGFALTDGGVTAYYADDGALDGGPGQFYAEQPSAEAGWNIYVYEPGFAAPEWAKNAVIYQIFPDRFRNGDPANDPTAADWFYPDERGHAFPVSPWNTIVPDPMPVDPAQNPDWYGTWSSTFYGGDLQGVTEKLDYLQSLGVDTIYFNPIFESPSNHRYDGRDYRQVDDNLGVLGDPDGSNALFVTLAAEVQKRGMHLILDGVPNHTSSDSPFFDKFERFDSAGACETVDSPYRAWYFFDPAQPAGTGSCAGDTNYRGWAGVSTLPQADTANEAVIDNWIGADGIATTWLQTPGVDGWRIDVVPDVVGVNPRFFERFRAAAKQANPEALLISETWGEADARQRVLGDEFDSTMNYRFRRAVLGFLRDTDFTEDGDGGIPALTATQAEAALRALQEDYPPAAFATAMNLLSSHDVNRAVRVLDHDGIDYTQLEPVNNFEDGRRRLALAAVLQFTLPGAPTVYYGDEVGLVGFGSDIPRDDPYNRQPYPWADAEGYDTLPTWRQADDALLAVYSQLGQLRNAHSFLRTGSWDTLLVDDAGLYVFGRKDATGASIVALNRSNDLANLSVDVGGYLPRGVALTSALDASTAQVGDDGLIGFDVPALGYQIWITPDDVDWSTPTVPAFKLTEENGGVTLDITGDISTTEFVLYRSLVNGGFAQIATVVADAGEATFSDVDLANGTTLYYQVKGRGATGLESAPSAAQPATPHVAVSSVTVADPTVMQHTLSAVEPSPETQGAVGVPGVTDEPGQAPGVLMQVGWAPAGSEEFTWVDGAYVTDNQGGADIYSATMLPETTGDYLYRWRASTTGGRDWSVSSNDGSLTVYANADSEAPKPPFRLDEVARSGSQIAVGIRVSRVPDLYALRVCRADLDAGEEGCATRTNIPMADSVYTDTTVTAGHTYVYTVQAVDNAFNVSEPSPAITLTAELIVVDVTWRVFVPAETPAGDLVYIAGDDGTVFGAAYNPSLTPMTPLGDDIWEWKAPIREGTRLLYKYTRGSWETVEQWGTISGFGNRQLQVVAGPDATMLVEDTATDWGAEGPDDRRGVQAWRDPLVKSVAPADASNGPAEEVSVEFSILVTAGDLGTVITVADAAGAPVAGEVTQASGAVFVFTPDAPLDSGVYTATAFNVAQTTPMVKPFTWSFTVP